MHNIINLHWFVVRISHVLSDSLCRHMCDPGMEATETERLPLGVNCHYSIASYRIQAACLQVVHPRASMSPPWACFMTFKAPVSSTSLASSQCIWYFITWLAYACMTCMTMTENPAGLVALETGQKSSSDSGSGSNIWLLKCIYLCRILFTVPTQ